MYRALGAKVARKREEAGLTPEQLADRLGCPVSHIDKIESGNKRLSVVHLLAISQALRCISYDLVADWIPVIL